MRSESRGKQTVSKSNANVLMYQQAIGFIQEVRIFVFDDIVCNDAPSACQRYCEFGKQNVHLYHRVEAGWSRTLQGV